MPFRLAPGLTTTIGIEHRYHVAGDSAGHKKALIGFYLGVLTIPGLFAFMPNRLMGTWLFG